MINRALSLLVIVLLIAVGILAWREWHRPAITETPQPEVTQKDGSKILERKIDPNAKPQQIVPKGAKVERIGKVKVQPTDPQGNPVTFDWTLIRDRDNGQRMIASSPDGKVITGSDIVIAPAKPHYRSAIALAGSSSGVAAVLSHDVTERLGVVAVGTMDARNGHMEQRGYLGAQYRFNF